jgi:Na+-translocating ferredoxin:NAD+ oxidoreductase RnfD subunit
MSEHSLHYGPFAPLLIGLLTLTLWFGFQTTQLLKERESLATLRTNQTTIYGNAQKMRAQLDAIAAEVAKLAQAGNPNATQLVNALKAKGITIDPNKIKPPADKPVEK